MTYCFVDSACVIAEIADGDGLTAAGAARLIPGRGGKRCNPSTVWRWATTGVLTPAGRVRLEAARVGCRLFTSKQALTRFLTAASAASAADQPPSVDPTPDHDRRLADARDTLRTAGI